MAKPPYLPLTDPERKEMLRVIGVNSADDLFQCLPQNACNAPFNLPEPLSELELKQELKKMSELNAHADKYICFLGAGYYRHFIPSVVPHFVGRSEFYTAYTPYQPEISQGTLQAIYEYQSFMCELMGMDVSNAGMYDGSSAAAEAALMACRITSKYKIAISSTVNPIYQKVIATYAKAHDLTFEEIEADIARLGNDVACLVVQYPNFFGHIEDLKALSDKAHKNGALLIVITYPIALAMFRPPGEFGADIVVGEGQCLGNPLNFGGPGLGIFTCRNEFLRQMPGRMVGRTTDLEGKMGFVLTLATREQHIRRERATSNICTNEALVALTTTVYLAAMGKQGLKRIAELCYHKAHYTAEKISRIPGCSLAFKEPFFNEFTVRCPASPSRVNEALFKNNIIGGLDISNMIENGMLISLTEMNTREEIDNLVKTMGTVRR